MSFNKNTWDKDYTGSPGLKKLGKIDWELKNRNKKSKETDKDTDND